MRATALWCMALLALVSCTSTQNQADEVPTSSPVATPSDESSVDPIAAARQSVVSVEVRSGETESVGAGVAVTPDGHILTSNTVVAAVDGAEMLVTFGSGDTAQATVVRGDARSHLAVIKTDETPAVEPAAFGDSDSVEVGDEVLLLATPTVGDTATAGAVRAKNRVFDGFSVMATSAMTSRGGVGAPLVNAAGETVGIVIGAGTAVGNDDTIDISYAVPSNIVTRVVEKLIDGEQVAHPSLGVAIEDAAGGGALVQDVTAGSPAQQAGLQPGDVINRLGDRPVDSAAELLHAVLSSVVGDELRVVFIRDGTEREIAVILGQAPARQAA